MGAEKKKFPKIRFEGFEGDLKSYKLKKIFTIFSGNAFSSKDTTKKGAVWLKIADVGIQKMTPDNVSYLPTDFKKKYEKFLIMKGDVVVALTRPILNGKLKIAQVNSFYNESLLNQRVGKIITNNDLIYIYTLLQKSDLISKLESSIAGTDPPNLSINEIKNIPIYISELSEQTQIGNFFQKMDEVIELQQKRLALTQDYKKSMLQKMFPQKGEKVPRVRFGGFEHAWSKLLLADIVEQIRSYSLSRSVETNEDTGLKYIHYGDIHLGKASYLTNDDGLSFINSDSIHVLLEKNDLVLADASEDYIGIAEPCVINYEPKTKLVAGLHTIAIRPSDKQDSTFLYYYFKTKMFKKHCYRVGTGMKVFGITFTNLAKYEGYFPCKEEQTAIGNFFQKLDEKIEVESAKLEKLQAMKKAMLQRMFV